MRIVKKIGILDRDINFAIGVTKYINQISPETISAMAFSSIGAIEEYLAADNLNLILMDDISNCEIREDRYEFHSVRCIHLTELKESSRSDVKAIPGNAIFKYQSVKGICNEIMYVLNMSKSKEEIVNGVRNVNGISQCICVYSPLGRCGKTSFSLALAKHSLSGEGFYIGMEEYSTYMSESKVPEVLYLIKERSPEVVKVLEESILEGTDVKAAVISLLFTDIRMIDRADMDWFVDTLKTSGQFPRYVFDIGTGVLGDISILGAFDKIYVPVLNDKNSISKVKHFERVLRELKLSSISERLVMVESILCKGSNKVDTETMLSECEYR